MCVCVCVCVCERERERERERFAQAHYATFMVAICLSSAMRSQPFTIVISLHVHTIGVLRNSFFLGYSTKIKKKKFMHLGFE